MRLQLIALFGISALLIASPANAQMCGGGKSQQVASQQGMACGANQAAADDPMEEQSAQLKSSQRSGMCGCCQNMAMMMRGMQNPQSKPGAMPDMPGMPMPKK